MKIQLAIQGGGAKLITLLGAASAIQELEAKNRIQLTRIVGTSAGAIVGALLAARVDVEAFRNQLTSGLGAKLKASLAKPSGFRWTQTVLSGKPLWETATLKKILQDIFEVQAKRLGKGELRTLNNIKAATGVELRVVATDLRNPDPIVYKPDGNDKDIVTALMDSAGIPLYFRTWDHGSLVDGGLVQNFPWDELMERGSNDYGPILGISFATKGRDIAAGRLEYAGALLNTALDSATQRARSRLGPERILTLPSKYDTFDFENGLSEGALGDHYDWAKGEAIRWFESRLRNSAVLITEDPWKTMSIASMEKLGWMYKSQHEKALLRYVELKMRIDAFTLEQSGQSDVVDYSFSFSTTNQEVYCHSIGLSQASHDSGSFKQSQISLLDPGGQLIAVDYLPMADRTSPEKREILLFFDQVLPAHSGPYTLTVQDVVDGLMQDLLRDRRDVYFARCPRTSQPVGKVREVLNVPSGFAGATMQPAQQLAGKQIPGRAMDPAELVSFSSPGKSWTKLGWLGENVQPQAPFGPLVIL